uniref:O-fucosyltransferase family protein n=1 Tax=Elaeis guineensis var. tenera TaxID=51953 RepID=A0A6I9RFB1_ELAGV|nr:O-fucosyltransferase 8 [Elaeis guineensis]
MLLIFDMGKEGSVRNLYHPSHVDGSTNAKASWTKKNYQGRYVSPANALLVHGMKNEPASFGTSKATPCMKRQMVICKHLRMVAFVVGLMCSFFILDSLMLTVIHHISFRSGPGPRKSKVLQDVRSRFDDMEKAEKIMYGRLISLASTALAKNEFQHGSFAQWKEPEQATTWRPCADRHNLVHQEHAKKQTGYILVSANGGLNQQRVAVCNAVAVAALLNATLVLPKFLYSSVWQDTSQFGDIYQEEYFINYLKDDVNIVKEMPSHLQLLDIEAIGSQITDMDIMKEAKPMYFVKVVLPLLLKNGVVHFLGFGNRLAFDPLPSNLQKLRCKCNFQALKFVPRIQEIGSLLVRRIRKYESGLTELDKHLLGSYMPNTPTKGHNVSGGPARYLALHMRFEMDMVAYSLCDFGGGEKERRELQAYREIHFPTLLMRIRNDSISPEELRNLGRCPLMPEEAALMLSALGFKRETYIYLAGSQIYGGQSRMLPFTRLYPNLITKEDLLSSSELGPFRNFSSQLAALDFIACATADVFAMTDSGSQLSSLVTGFRTYHGRGNAPTLRPNKKRFAKILSENRTIQWHEFEERVRKMIEENQRVIARRRGRSIYRQPRTPGCMCEAPNRITSTLL